MKKFTLIIVLLLVLSFIFVFILALNVQETEPNTIVVPDDYPTIQNAIDSADEGDTLYVKNGTYCENVRRQQ